MFLANDHVEFGSIGSLTPVSENIPSSSPGNTGGFSLDHWSPKSGPQTGNFLEMQIPGLQSRSTESETVWCGPDTCG